MNDKRKRKKEGGINVRWAEPLCPAHIYAICTCMYAYSDLFANKCNVIFMACNSIAGKYEKGVEIVLILALRYRTKQPQEGI